MFIEDGTGKGYNAKVNKRNQILAETVSSTIVEDASSNGNSYNINTGTITLTSDSKSAVLYLKNNGANDIVIAQIGYLFGNSAGGSGDASAEVIKNPTTGTLISSASDVAINTNKNFGSSNTITVDAYKGSEGDAITDGEVAYYSLFKAIGGYTINTGSIVIPKGTSIGVNIIPQSGNTSMSFQCFFSIIEKIV
jgi:hypothetical protein